MHGRSLPRQFTEFPGWRMAEAALPPGHCCLVGQVIGLPLAVSVTLAKLQRTNCCAQAQAQVRGQVTSTYSSCAFPSATTSTGTSTGFPPLLRTAGKEVKGRSMGECGARTPTPGYGSRSTLPIGASRPGSGALVERQPLHPKGASTVHRECSTGCLDCRTRVCRLPPLHSTRRSTSTKPQSILSTVDGLWPVRITVPSSLQIL